MDAVIVGAGPNGLAAAVEIARAGHRVVVFEAGPTVGGSCRSAELTLPGFRHDVCSAVHPFAVASPFFQSLPLAACGLEWVAPPIMLAHPLDGGEAACLFASVEQTAARLGADGDAYRRLFTPLVQSWPAFSAMLQGRLGWPRRPLALAEFAWRAMTPATRLAQRTFAGRAARALVGGIAAHGMMPLDRRPTGGVALVLNLLAHTAGWCIPRGGSQKISDALAGHLRSLGGTIVTDSPIESLDDLPAARAVLCDLSPRPFLAIARHRLPAAYRRSLERYRYGSGVYKVDWALDRPVPWANADCRHAGTVHVGGTLEEIAASEQETWDGQVPERPFVLVTQPTVFDPSRAPQRRHIAWGYCHVPAGCEVEMLPRIERQIERFAPGFRDRILARSVMRPADLERYNPNLVGGDIGAGVMSLGQLITRPTWRTYSTPVDGLYLCSAATPPGVGVHGLCGYFAARRALRQVLAD